MQFLRCDLRNFKRQQMQKLKNDFPEVERMKLGIEEKKNLLISFCASSPNSFSCFVGDLGAGENFASSLFLSKFKGNRNIFEAVSLQADVKLSSSPVFLNTSCINCV